MDHDPTLLEQVLDLLNSGEPIPDEIRDRVHLALLFDIQRRVNIITNEHETLKEDVTLLKKKNILLFLEKKPKVLITVSVITLLIIEILTHSIAWTEFVRWFLGAPFLFKVTP